MNREPNYIAIVDRSPLFASGLAHCIQHSHLGRVAIPMTSYLELERNLIAFGQPDLVVAADMVVRSWGRVEGFRRVMQHCVTRWLLTGPTERPLPLPNLSIANWLPISGYLSTKATANEYIGTIESILSSQCTTHREQIDAPDVRRVLTPRQEEIFELVCRGCSNKRIALNLHIAESTVKEHMTGILEKIGVRTRTEAIAWAQQGAADGVEFQRGFGGNLSAAH
jgi:DNA-binding NarL/FixJ family response regulator